MKENDKRKAQCVSKEQGKKLKNDGKFNLYIETSAKTRENIFQVF